MDEANRDVQEFMMVGELIGRCFWGYYWGRAGINIRAIHNINGTSKIHFGGQANLFAFRSASDKSRLSFG